MRLYQSDESTRKNMMTVMKEAVAITSGVLFPPATSFLEDVVEHAFTAYELNHNKDSPEFIIDWFTTFQVMNITQLLKSKHGIGPGRVDDDFIEGVTDILFDDIARIGPYFNAAANTWTASSYLVKAQVTGQALIHERVVFICASASGTLESCGLVWDGAPATWDGGTWQ